ncbi:sulfite reductase subunit alpha [Variovorax sp. YR216]|uniref:sulfite reductase subunit alpha n=1 Tax=Variovorax sp. YR216 TaxID=1882828 RepID=UPI00089D6944|nr:sulfite reductase subunit alpha [Variovorax sp. YR216]SEB19113.1 sulfite reductase (NADPH) flavoprotein alpha-component [Variovorax sp. YR216]
MNDPAWRAIGAGMTVLAYAALCASVYWRQRRLRADNARAAAALAGGDTGQQALVLFASQTGNAETLAWKTARWLHERGTPSRLMPLNDADAETLRRAGSAYFIASTYGEGDAPDGASVFAERVMGGAVADLSSLRYAVLALGDRQYANFCAFGRALDEWLHAKGARRQSERIEVDNGDAVQLAAWQAHCSGSNAEAVAEAPVSAPQPWRLVRRTLLNEGSAGGPIFELAFTPADGSAAHWESGDTAQITLDSDPGRPREYSIASIAADGEMQFLVRQERHPDGTLGAASGLLTSTLPIGDTATFRIRPHRGFRLGGNADRPLILIGNGTGLAGLRSHLRARAARGRRENWLVFGERNARCDFLCRDEIASWQQGGVLGRVDMVFSRDQEEALYVQHRLLQAHEQVSQWIASGAAIYVCGSLNGMASGVDAALRQILGTAVMGELSAADRYRRDVY